MHSDWSKEDTRLGTSNQSALFQRVIVVLKLVWVDFFYLTSPYDVFKEGNVNL